MHHLVKNLPTLSLSLWYSIFLGCNSHFDQESHPQNKSCIVLKDKSENIPNKYTIYSFLVMLVKNDSAQLFKKIILPFFY